MISKLKLQLRHFAEEFKIIKLCNIAFKSALSSRFFFLHNSNGVKLVQNKRHERKIVKNKKKKSCCSIYSNSFHGYEIGCVYSRFSYAHTHSTVHSEDESNAWSSWYWIKPGGTRRWFDEYTLIGNISPCLMRFYCRHIMLQMDPVKKIVFDTYCLLPQI